MGAVFAMFSGWYFWVPKILGLNYNLMLSKVQFWILFIGVNLTFFPQHFLGLQGMPRRIADYPDAFAGWNIISSFGSIISVVAAGLFLHIVYLQLAEGKSATRYPWLTAQYFSDTLQTLLNRSYTSLEWALTSPPKPHAFVSLPVQSGFFISKEWLKTIFISFILIMLISFPLRTLAKLCGFPFFVLFFLSGLISYILFKVRQGLKGEKGEITLFEFLSIFSVSFCFSLIFAFFVYPSVNYIIMIGIEGFLLKNLFSELKNLLYNTFDFTVHMEDKGKNDDDGVPRLRDGIIQAQYIEESIKNLKSNVDLKTKSLQGALTALPPVEEILKKPNGIDIMLELIQSNFELFIYVSHQRMGLIDVLCKYLPEDEHKEKIKEHKAKFVEYDKNKGNIDFLKKEDMSKERKVEHFYHLFNAHRNRTSKELNKMEDITVSILKKSPYVKFIPEIIQVLNKDFIESKKDFKDNQDYLIKKVQQAVEKLKKEEKK